jgi:hypothetical protein
MKKLFKHTMLQVFSPLGGHWVMQLIGMSMAAVMSFIAPVGDFLFLILGLVIADLYTGWRKTRKDGKRLNSAGVGRTIEKAGIYLVLMLVARGVDHLYHLSGTVSMAYAIGGLIVGRELLSILENADAVEGTDFAPRLTSLFGWLLKKKQDPE